MAAPFFNGKSSCLAHLVQKRNNQQRNNVDDFNHRVDSGTCGILVRIADRIAGNGSLMGVAALAAMVAVFDKLLGVIPGAAAGGHGNGDKDPGNDGTDDYT